MQDVKNFFKDIFKNKRKRAVVSLLFWIAFFVIVFFMIGGSNTVPKEYRSGESRPSVNALDNFKKMSNFEFSYLITIEDKVVNNYKIDGTYYNKNYYFQMNGQDYYFMDNNVYLVNDNERKLVKFNSIDSTNLFNIINFELLTKDSVSTFIESSEEKNKTTYKDGKVVTNFVYKNYDNKQISIVSSEYSNIIDNIEMDFSNYFNQNYKQFTINMTYKNINNIANYDKNYDDYQIIKEGD